MISRRKFLGAGSATVATAGEVPPKSTRMLFGGDVILARGVAKQMHGAGAGAAALPFRDLAAHFNAADIAFVNLESPFSDKPPLRAAEMIFRADPASVAALTLAGIDIVSTANNHARDCGAYGVGHTLDVLGKAGIAAVGTARNPESLRQGAILERNGARFGFLAYTFDQANGNWPDQDPRIAGLDHDRMAEEVRDLGRRADAVIVSMHAGWEYWTQVNPYQIAFARRAIQAGASAVVGHHPHVVQRVERYLDGVIFHSLGNLVFDQQRPGTSEGLLAEVYFHGGVLTGYKLMPVNIVDCVPSLASNRPHVEVRMRY